MGTHDEHVFRTDIGDDGIGPIEHVILHGAKAVLADAAERDEWDVAPRLIAMAQGPVLTEEHLPDEARETLPEEVREALRNGQMGQQMLFHQLDINPEVWTTGEAAQVLGKLAKYAEKHPPNFGLLNDDELRLIGLLFVSEAWMVKARGEEMDAAREYARERHLSTHPDRVEIRMVYAVDTAGYQYMLNQERGSEVVDEHVQGPGLGDQRQRVAGEIPDALTKLLDAIVPQETL